MYTTPSFPLPPPRRSNTEGGSGFCVEEMLSSGCRVILSMGNLSSSKTIEVEPVVLKLGGMTRCFKTTGLFTSIATGYFLFNLYIVTTSLSIFEYNTIPKSRVTYVRRK
ncbi:hypothetical protein CDAR_94001 [Caerostris darwini]|uniref:Uncharacterized protein n=1 Tax=Caerostris darwini TaxID=1538125 RepID=A0AAV4NL95_9ARAC|nr:hypothetical protein CDAR_94001 [Caerostris darwini]